MFEKLKRLGLSVVLFTCVVSFSGCFWLLLGAGAGAGGMAWHQGSLHKNVDASLDQAYKAAKKAFDKLDIPIRESSQDDEKAIVKGEYDDGKDATVTMKALTERATELRIRVGAFGDRSRSESILTAITRQL